MQVTTIGLDLAKSVLQVHGEDAQGQVRVRKRLRRAQVLRWFANTPACLIGMEACGGAHYWARALTGLGHTVRIMPPQYVRPFVRTNKSDARDAQAICRAVRAPDMTFVPLASLAEQDLQAVHRIRTRLLKERTALCNQTRGLLLEYGLAVPKGVGRLRTQLRAWLGAPPTEMTPARLRMVQEQYSELLTKDAKLADYTLRIEAAVKTDPVGQRLLAVPGIGPLSASGLLLKARQYAGLANGRGLAVLLGLTPRHEGTGGTLRMLGISKRGDRYLRSLLMHGARAVAARVAAKTDPVSRWLAALIARRGVHKACVALANKNARIAFALIVSGEAYQVTRAAGGVNA